MTNRNISAEQLKNWLTNGETILIDVRETDEFSQQHIPQSQLIQLSIFDDNISHLKDEKRKVVFQCFKGNRSKIALDSALKQYPNGDFYSLEGGIEAWKEAGYTVIDAQTKSNKMPIMRQVHTVAGSLILLFSIFSLTGIYVSSFITAFIGAGLLLSGLTGFCGMATILQKMPWNK